MGKFGQIRTGLWPLIYVKISFLGSILSIYGGHSRINDNGSISRKV